MGTLHIWILSLTFVICFGNTFANSQQTLSISSSEELSQEEDELISPNYVLPKQIFNDGKPFYVQRDPISGQLDFNSKKSANTEPENNEVINPQEKIVLSSAQSNIHDLLNLPVKYSSSKFVYPLVSSSYANLKYQGSNKYNPGNHHKISVQPTLTTKRTTKTPTQQPPKYYTENQKKDITKLYPAAGGGATATTHRPSSSPPPQSLPSSTTRRTINRTTMSTTTTTAPLPTTRRPLFDKNITKNKYSSTKKYATTTAEPTTTTKQIKYTRHHPKYTTSAPPATTTKQFTSPTIIEHTKQTTTTTTTAIPPTNKLVIKTTTSTSTPTPTTTTTTTTKMPTEQITTSTHKPISTLSSLFSTLSHRKPISNRTTVKPPPFFPLPSFEQLKPKPPSSYEYHDLDSADVYSKINEKNEPSPISLTDIFSELSNADHKTQFLHPNQGLDQQGNLIQPISPSQPSPFTLHQVTKSAFPTRATRQPYSPTIPFKNRPLPSTSMPLQTEKPLQAISVSNKYDNNYVHYEVQQPNMMQYQSIPSMNNVVISPDQNSASFVLGSQQAVGSSVYVGSVEKEPLFEKKRPIQFGTVISEDLNQNSARPTNQILISTRPTHLPLLQEQQSDNQQFNAHQQNLFQEPIPQLQQQIINEHQHTQDMLVSSNIRFPNDIELEELQHNTGISHPVNGHAQPIVMSQKDSSTSIQFPKVEQDSGNQNIRNYPSSSNNIVFGSDSNLPEPQTPHKHEVLTLNQHQLHNKLNFPQLPEDLTPPLAPDHHLRLPAAEQSHRFPVEQPHRHHMEQPHMPLQMRPPHLPPSSGFLYNEFTRKPAAVPRPYSDRPLPNILPQFRPNAKISQGHPSYNKEPGNIRVTHSKYPYPNRGIPPPFTHRRTPIPAASRYPVKIIMDHRHEPVESNRRVFRIPAQNPHFYNRQYIHRKPQINPAMRYVDNYVGERHAPVTENRESYNGYPASEAQPERLPSFEEDDYVVHEAPPQSVVNNFNSIDNQSENQEQTDSTKQKLEPVVTLQMIHSHKKSSPTDPDSEETPIKEQPEPILENGSSQGVYVVYPAKPSEMNLEITMPAETQEEAGNESSDAGSYGGSGGIDYQNTPFSVVREQPQEPILMVKNKPQTQYKDKFPYPLEQPDPAFAEFSKKQEVDRYNRETFIDMIPRVVNRRNDIQNIQSYQQSTDIPIAIAYTPTEPNQYYSGQHTNNKFSYPNLAEQVISEIHGTQTEAVMHNEYDTRGQNYEKDFMAPFYPSSAVTDSPNGWSVFQGSATEKPHISHEKNDINRADKKDDQFILTDSDSAIISASLPKAEHLQQNQKENDQVSTLESSSTTKKYENDSFQPELQGGFKPIYPPGYKIKDSSEQSAEDMISPLKELFEKNDALSMPNIPKSNDITPIPEISPKSLTTDTISTTEYSVPISSTESSSPVSSTTDIPQTLNTTSTTEKPKLKKKKETSLAALLFGDYDDYEYDEKPENLITNHS